LATKPQNVVVELCKSRSAQLYKQEGQEGKAGTTSAGSNALSLSGGSLLESFQRTVALGGRSALLLRVLLGNLSSKLSAEVGVNSGAEFFAAREAAEEVGAQIVLGDRPIEVTLRRAWEALPRASRWNLFLELLEGVRGAQSSGGALAAAQAVEQLKDDDAVSWMLSSLASKYPQALPPLVHERDLYMAWSLKRSKAVNGTETVVGVLGKGHMRGVCYALMHDSENLRFRDVAGSKGKNKKGGAAKAVIQFVGETAVVSAAIYAWSQYSSSSTSGIISP
jgi:pheromone shutdown protein TraB